MTTKQTGIKLTEKETLIMKAGRSNNFGDCMEYPQWSFAVIDYSTLDAKVARGVISSLVKKGLVFIQGEKGENEIFGYTDLGKELYDTLIPAELPIQGPAEPPVIVIEESAPTDLPENIEPIIAPDLTSYDIRTIANEVGKSEKMVRAMIRKKGHTKTTKEWSFTTEEFWLIAGYFKVKAE